MISSPVGTSRIYSIKPSSCVKTAERKKENIITILVTLYRRFAGVQVERMSNSGSKVFV